MDFHQIAMCIDMVEICFGIAYRQISSILTELSIRDTSIFLFPEDNLSKYRCRGLVQNC